jgi:NDP-sugar pyrophosphorylase family protein
MAVDSVVSGGCVISGAEVVGSLLFTNVRVNERSYIEKSLLFPDVVIGADCVVKNAIIDTGGVVPSGTQIGVNPEEDAKRFYVTEKVRQLITREMLAQLCCSAACTHSIALCLAGTHEAIYGALVIAVHAVCLRQSEIFITKDFGSQRRHDVGRCVQSAISYSTACAES